jgi:nitrogen fixation protein FixH
MRPFEYLRARAALSCGFDGSPPAKPVTGRTVLLSLLGFFGVVMGVNGLMMALAISTMPGTEVESPYQEGIGYNTEIGAANDQAGRHLHVDGHISREPDGRAAVTIEARDSNGAPLANLAFIAQFARPTDARADRIVTLKEAESGNYRGEAADVAAGLWEIELRADRGSERVFRSKNRITLE